MQRPTAQLPAPDYGTASHDQVSTTSTGGRGSIFTPHRRSPTGEFQDYGTPVGGTPVGQSPAGDAVCIRQQAGSGSGPGHRIGPGRPSGLPQSPLASTGPFATAAAVLFVPAYVIEAPR